MHQVSSCTSWLQNRQPQSFLNDLAPKLSASSQEAALRGTRYNVPLINSLVLYVGMQVSFSRALKCPMLLHLFFASYCLLLGAQGNEDK
jgi:hypothetical protein